MAGGTRIAGTTLAAALACAALVTPGAAQVKPAAPQTQPATPAVATDNPYNDALLRMTPEQQAAKLATFLGGTCIGTRPFLMGVTKVGRAKGYAYWSIECAGAGSFMIQLDPDGRGAAIDCQTLKENGEGRECYKAF